MHNYAILLPQSGLSRLYVWVVPSSGLIRVWFVKRKSIIIHFLCINIQFVSHPF